MEEEIKRFKFIGLNDKASQEHLLQNTLILSGFYSSVPARLLFVAVSRDFCYFLKSQIDACPHRISATNRILNISQYHYLLH